MTVSTLTNSVIYRGNGATTEFAVPFKVLDEDHLVVTRRDYVTGEVLYTYVGTDFTYDGIGDTAGTLTLAGAALDDDFELVIARIVPYTQDLDIVNSGGFYPETVEEQLDLIVMGVQQVADLAGRGTTVPVGEAGFELSKAADRAGKFYAFDADGGFVASSGTGTDDGLRTDLAEDTGATLIGEAGGGTVQEAITSAQDALDSALRLGQLNRLMAKLENETGDANIVIPTDSTGDATTEWPYLLAGLMATAFPRWTVKTRYWTAGSYAAATTLQTGTGTRTLTFWIAAIAGAIASRFASDDFTAGIVTPDPDVVFPTYGHNGDIAGAPGSYTIGTGERQLSYFNPLADKLNRYLPNVPVVLIGENPSTNDNGSNPAGTQDGFMDLRLKFLRPFAARQGWGFIDVHSAFLQSSTALDDLLAGDTHPNAAGSALWAATVWEVMEASRSAQQSGSSYPGQLLCSWNTLVQFQRWGVSNATLAANTTQFETAEHSINITSGAAVGFIYIAAIGAADIKAVQGKYVTFSVWQRVPSGNISSSGRLDIEDDAGTTSSVGVTQGAGFVLFTASRKIDAAATFVKLYLYAAADVATNTISVDRATLSLGLHSVDTMLLLKQGTATYNPASLADGEGVTTTVTVTGALLGEYVLVSFSLDLQGVTLTAYVSATNTVSVRFQNETGGAVDLASGTLSARIL